MQRDAFFKSVETKMTTYAQESADIRAVLIVGATERESHPADEWSDLDIEIFTDDITKHTDDTLWLRQFGAIWVSLHEKTDESEKLLVLFEGGHKVDFTFFPTATLRQHAAAGTLSESQRRGYRVLVDKDNLSKNLPTAGTVPVYSPPDSEAFRKTVEAFWYGTVYVARQIRRRNLWVVKYRDWNLKDALLQMLVWHANTRNTDVETWHDGHFMSEWLDGDTYTEVQTLFAGYSAAESWRALLTSMHLFRRIARETAVALDFLYPVTLDDNITGLITRIYTEDPETIED